jgi:hypothetical protein
VKKKERKDKERQIDEERKKETNTEIKRERNGMKMKERK